MLAHKRQQQVSTSKSVSSASASAISLSSASVSGTWACVLTESFTPTIAAIATLDFGSCDIVNALVPQPLPRSRGEGSYWAPTPFGRVIATGVNAEITRGMGAATHLRAAPMDSQANQSRPQPMPHECHTNDGRVPTEGGCGPTAGGCGPTAVHYKTLSDRIQGTAAERPAYAKLCPFLLQPTDKTGLQKLWLQNMRQRHQSVVRTGHCLRKAMEAGVEGAGGGGGEDDHTYIRTDIERRFLLLEWKAVVWQCKGTH